jgi:glutathione synthase/RimK-type ligase-like ATP-grasp enzyme
MVRALGVYREPEFSPGKVEADAAILDLVLAHLAEHGIGAATVAAATVIDNQIPQADLILAMCQGEPALKRLAAVQQAGVLVINSPQAIRSCYRDRMGQILIHAAAPVPPGLLVQTSPPTDRAALGQLDPERGIYVKRGDLHALSAADVCRAENHAALATILRDFTSRGIQRAYLQQEVEGRVIKFYGVTGTDYFSFAHADHVSGALRTRLHDAAQAAAKALGLEVWGGDGIIDGEQFKLVDFNDWPSFERVRAPAATAITRRMLDLLAARADIAGAHRSHS